MKTPIDIACRHTDLIDGKPCGARANEPCNWRSKVGQASEGFHGLRVIDAAAAK